LPLNQEHTALESANHTKTPDVKGVMVGLTNCRLYGVEFTHSDQPTDVTESPSTAKSHRQVTWKNKSMHFWGLV
jgi:hypothetical protein